MREIERKTRILVLDGEVQICHLIQRVLSAEGCDCITASAAAEAQGHLMDGDIDLMILDIMMPVTTGMELWEFVRRRFPDIAVIMATGVDDRATAVREVQLGAYGYLIKPFERNEVIINVINALERRRLEMLQQQYEQFLEGGDNRAAPHILCVTVFPSTRRGRPA